ncbi:MAG: hypothetical protein Q4C53_03060 [Clostridia bacterium]|nr:hypothetical protein [Clostridia bacterium]
MNRKDAAVIAAFLAVLALFVWTVGRIGTAEQNSEAEMVRTAVKNAALTCYAVEGAFPQEVGYLRENYGLLFDEDRFIVAYDGFASNIMPDIRVLERGKR